MSFLIETRRLYIRQFRNEDAEELHKIFGDPEVMKRIPGGSSLSIESTQQRLDKIIQHQQENGFSLWALIRKEDKKLIGDCGLILVEGRGPEVELSYDINREFWGKGYATEAGRECLRFGFERLGLKRIIAITDPDHFASRRVMEKCGMTYQGIAKYYDRDLVLYSIERRRAMPTGLDTTSESRQ